MKRRSFLSRALSFLGLSALGFPRLRTAPAIAAPGEPGQLPTIKDVYAAMRWSEYRFMTDPELNQARAWFAAHSPWGWEIAFDAITYGNSLNVSLGSTGAVRENEIVYGSRLCPLDIQLYTNEYQWGMSYIWHPRRDTPTGLFNDWMLHGQAVQHLTASRVLEGRPRTGIRNPMCGFEVPPCLTRSKQEMIDLLMIPASQQPALHRWVEQSRPGDTMLIRDEPFIYVSHAAFLLEVDDLRGNRFAKDIDRLEANNWFRVPGIPRT